MLISTQNATDTMMNTLLENLKHTLNILLRHIALYVKGKTGIRVLTLFIVKIYYLFLSCSNEYLCFL